MNMIKNLFARLLARFASNTNGFDAAIASFNTIIDKLQAEATKQAVRASAAVKAKVEADERLAKVAAEVAAAKAEAEAEEKLANADAERAAQAAAQIKALVGKV